ncbi:MAG: hypothetical protein IKS83_09285, partial [Victivallales bacterium]|nr:hypothetical protein [Victivallales bacterium]
ASDNSEFRIQHSAYSFIIGNPPIVGHQYRTREQAADMDAVYADWKDTNYGKLDYVCAWYKKAADYIREQGAGIRDQGTLTTGHWPLTTKCAFVSTNSICQGESVAAMWKPLFERAGVEIDFAHRTFRWDNEASEKAHVHCVIVGFHCLTPSPPSSQSGEEETSRTSRTLRESKIIFDGGKAIPATHIDGYLIDAPDVFIENRGRPRHGAALPSMSKGSQPTDGGNLILSPDERDEILAKWPDAASFILRYIGSDDFINNVVRYCLWLKDVAPNLYRHIPPVMERLARVAEMRRKSPTASVRRDAETPMLFTQIRQPATDYLVIPKVSSERRKYIPIGYLTPEVIANDMLCIIPEASPYMFGVLTSSVHMAWMRVVAGRLEMRYRYTPAVYNNFPWPLAPAAAVEGRKSTSPAPGTFRTLDLQTLDLQ